MSEKHQDEKDQVLSEQDEAADEQVEREELDASAAQDDDAQGAASSDAQEEGSDEEDSDEDEDSEEEDSDEEDSDEDEDGSEPREALDEDSAPSEEGDEPAADSEDELVASAASLSDVDGLAAYFNTPDDLMHAAELAYKKGFKRWDTFSPFPIHGMDDAMGMGRSWLPWVTFGAGGTGFLIANLLQFGTLTFDWPMIIGGKPHAPWPSFVPIMFELTVLIGGVTSALVMLIASGCFRKPKIIDPEITKDRFVLWVSAQDELFGEAHDFMETLHPEAIKPIKFEG